MSPSSGDDNEKIIAEARRARELRERDYRERALRMYPHVCARCGRAFEGKKLRELTVHHRNHNHEDNPSDGSNWELLCIYCHDNEHQKNLLEGTSAPESDSSAHAVHQPFARLRDLMEKKK
jgi:5-methylcytosine-specific restriction endonuclease McrA